MSTRIKVSDVSNQRCLMLIQLVIIAKMRFRYRTCVKMYTAKRHMTGQFNPPSQTILPYLGANFIPCSETHDIRNLSQLIMKEWASKMRRRERHASQMLYSPFAHYNPSFIIRLLILCSCLAFILVPSLLSVDLIWFTLYSRYLHDNARLSYHFFLNLFLLKCVFSTQSRKVFLRGG